MRRLSHLVAAVAVAVCTALLLPACGVSSALQSDSRVPLRSAEDAKVFSPPEDVTFTLQEVSLAHSGVNWSPRINLAKLETAGSLVFSDGMITEMDLHSTAPNGDDFAFTLNEPVVLRPEGDPGSHLAATGTVRYRSYETDDFTLWLTPQFGDDRSTIDMRVEIDLPKQLPISGSESTTRLDLVLHYAEV